MKKAVTMIRKQFWMILALLMLGAVVGAGTAVLTPVTVSADTVKNGWDAKHTHFYEKGKLVTGKKKIDGYWYYFSKKSGKIQKNKFIVINKKTGKTCYYDENGHAVRGEHKIGKYWYFFDAKFAMAVNSFQTVPNGSSTKVCYYNSKGHRVKGLKKIGKYYYLFDSKTGARKKGFQTVTRDGKQITCYFTSKGRMVFGDRTIKNVIYSFNKKTGALVDLMIAHASGDENGNYYYGNAGDQTGTEVCVRSWYNRPWNCVLRPKDPAMAEKIATAMERAAANDNIGYDMIDRNTLYEYVKGVGYDPGLVTQLCETDCSALVSVACMYAGISPKVLFVDNNSSVTGNLRSRLEGTGYFQTFTTKAYTTKTSKLKRGDILLYEWHHTAVVTGKWKKS